VVIDGDFDRARPLASGAVLRGQFLFGAEMCEVFFEFYEAMRRTKGPHGLIHELEAASKGLRIPNDLATDAAKRILQTINAVADPYMRMDQKRVRTPTEWFRDQNAKRLSYGDQ
jgi:hypothetical protein